MYMIHNCMHIDLFSLSSILPIKSFLRGIFLMHVYEYLL